MNHMRGNSSWYGKDPAGRSYKLKGAAVAASAGLAAAALAAVPASATLGAGGVQAGHNITAFANIDFIAASGWAVGDSVTVTVERNGVLIGTATGAAVDAEGTGVGALEVNHGPEGAPLPGDCWEGTTPDIRPGDVVTATGPTGTDRVIVDNIAFTGGPQLQPNRNITVPFTARLANGNPVPIGRIDSAEFRAASNNSVRFEAPNVLVRRQPGGRPGQYNMVYPFPYTPTRNDDNAPFNVQQRRRALLGDGHAVGFGHVDPLPLESMLQDGLGDTPGPAPGCDAPSAQWGVTTVFPGSVNRSNLARGLTVRGLATGATAVNVQLRDGTAPVVTKTATGTNNWTATFTRAELRSLNGNVRVVGRYDVAGGTITGKTSSFLKDLVRPNRPRPSLRQGTYRVPRRTALRTGSPANQIRYTVGRGRQARPNANRGAVYSGRIRLTAPKQVIKAVAIDRAGNVSPVRRLVYRIRR